MSDLALEQKELERQWSVAEAEIAALQDATEPREGEDDEYQEWREKQL